MQAIRTQLLPAARNGKSRVVATCSSGKATLECDLALTPEQNHVAAARALADQLGWRGEWAFGRLPDSSFAHVFLRVEP